MTAFLAAQVAAAAAGGVLLLTLGVRRVPYGLALPAAWLAGTGGLALERLVFSQMGIPWDAAALALPWLTGFGWLAARSRAQIAGVARRLPGARVIIAALMQSVWGIAIGATVLVWTGVMVFHAVGSPLEGWDAWAIWFLKGRALQQAGGVPVEFFSDPRFAAYAHLDYPLLVPLTIAGTYAWTGDADATMKAWWPLLAGACSAGLYWGLHGLAPAAVRLAGALLLLGTPELARHALDDYNGYADLPLATLTLFGAVFLYRSLRNQGQRASLAAALFFGLAGFTKNEGLVIAAAGCGLILAHGLRLGGMGWRGALLVLLIVVAPVAPWQAQLRVWGLRPEVTPLLGVLQANWGPRAGDIWTALSSMVSDPARFNYLWPGAAALAALALIASPRRWAQALPLVVLVAAQVAGAGAAYLLTPNDLAWQLQTSADRVVFQWAPPLVLLMTIYLGILVESSPNVVDVTDPSSGERTPLPG